MLLDCPRCEKMKQHPIVTGEQESNMHKKAKKHFFGDQWTVYWTRTQESLQKPQNAIKGLGFTETFALMFCGV